MLTFKVLSGNFNQGDGKIYNRGDLVKTEQELDKRFGPRKFQRLEVPEGYVPAPETSILQDEFTGMTVAELRQFAEDEEIDLGHAVRKETLLSVIRKAVASL